MAQLNITRFKGMTDYIFNGDPGYAEIAENILINPDGSLETRYGSRPALNVKHNSRIDQIFQVDDDIITTSEGKLFINGVEEKGPSDNDAFFNGTSETRVSWTKQGGEYFLTADNYSLPIKLYRDNFNILQLRSAGLPVPSQGVSGTASNDDGKSYLYAVVFKYEFINESLTKIDLSTPIFSSISNASNFNLTSRSISLTSIPTLSNGSTGNWDTTNIKVVIYRTPSTSASTFYQVAELNNGVTTFNDTTTDSDLIENERLYTSFGLVPNNIAPRAKYIFECNNAIYYLNVQEDGEIRSNMGLQSIPNDGDSVPGDFFFETEGAQTGGGSAKGYPVIFTEDKTYRLDGLLLEDGSGSIAPSTVSDTVGCISHNSIVKTNQGLYFAAKDGFYITDGYNVKKISINIDKTYRTISEYPQFISGIYCDKEKRVRWTVSSKGQKGDEIYVYDEYINEFVKETGDEYFSPSALFYNDELFRGTEDGYLFVHRDKYLDDSKAAPPSLPDTWGTTPIIYRWKTVAMDMGYPSINKWFNKINITGAPPTELDLSILSYSDKNNTVKELYPTYFRPEIVWGDPDLEWGDSSILWNVIKTMNKSRRFKRGGLRSKRRQIELTNAHSILQKSDSDTASYVQVITATKTISMNSPATHHYRNDYSGDYIIVNGNSYEIVSNTSDTAIVNDPSNTLTDGIYPYSISGFGKAQRMHISSLTIEYKGLDDDGGFPGQQSNETTSG